MKHWAWPALIGTILRVLAIFPLDPPCQRDECSYLALAESLVGGEMLGMTSPEDAQFWMWAPAYPYLLAASEWLTGQAEWVKVPQVLLFPLLAWMAWRLAGRGREGLLTAWLLGLSPTLAWFSGRIWSETIYVTVLFALLLSLGWARKGGAGRSLVPGLLLGLCVLLRGVATYMLPVLLLGRLWGRFRQASAWRGCALLTLAAVLTVTPWSAVATAHHDGFVLSDRTLGQMMWLGNNDFPPVSFDNELINKREHLSQGRRHCDPDLGLVAWDDCEVAAGKQWIREHPGEFLRRMPLRVAQLFNPNSFLTRSLRKELVLPRPITEMLCLATLLFSFISVVGGTIGGLSRGRGWLPVTVAGLIVYQVATVSIVAGLSRYRVPLDALWMMGVALLLAEPRKCLAALWGRRGLLVGALVALLVPAMLVFLVPSYGWVPKAPTTLPKGGSSPDLVLISIDTLRADHLGAWGYSRDTSPNLDDLARRGVRFAQARSPSPWTLPSHATMLTGLLPPRHLVVDAGQAIGDPLLQQQLQQAGYATGAFVTSLFVGERFGFAEGFDRFEDFDVRDKTTNLEATVDAEEVVDEALRWMDGQEGQAAFLFMHLYDVHYPYAAPDGLDERFDRPSTEEELSYRKYFYYLDHPLSEDAMQHQVAQYDEEIAYVDAQLGRLFSAFQDREVVFVITSDHGEEFGERGSWGHAHTLHPEQLHVPLIISGAGSAGVVETAVGLQDIAPTLLDLAGLEPVGEGLSLVPALDGEELPERAFVCDTSRFSTNRLGVYRAGQRLDWDLKSGERVVYVDAQERVTVDDQELEAELLVPALELLGTPWSSEEPVPVRRGLALVDGVPSEEGEGDFAVVPVDARVGEWSVKQPPGLEDPVIYRGPSIGEVELGTEEWKRLEALGYIQ